MIVVSLLLILVAMVLLGSGLVRGSNTLLVSAIAASLLAAIALAIGARQSAPAQVGLPWPRRLRRAAVPRTATVTPGAAAAATGDSPTPRAGAPASEPVSPARVVSEPVSPARAASAPASPARVVSEPVSPARAASAPASPAAADAAAGTPSAHTGPPPTAPPDQSPPGDRPSAATGAATGATGPPAGVGSGPGVESRIPAQGGPGRDDQPEDDLAGDIPADEPAAQVVSPADVARVARLSDPVRVVDGRPRYHVAECVHLLGRESEPLPVSEAITLGFTPCGLCEPDLVLLDRTRQR